MHSKTFVHPLFLASWPAGYWLLATGYWLSSSPNYAAWLASLYRAGVSCSPPHWARRPAYSTWSWTGTIKPGAVREAPCVQIL
ncbi:hypothetical protein CC85DRAFT_283611 [Cutaneotrichosporon oleaginosum]|uniref:Uncharacterized protein n=1 Tax=Cutaneotrichosporon oleaginosum TaxID=879819 RepID=A0A0J0XTE9_9TREE|nr:uncharacterized protein CC85DRAFT_283611 [Cutaneotrichosporon oleaginosum]KLT44367.1 hypothetical protein CC85DRAFT_283611 [Cutaneotrichosporon oleaginosum]TXT07908.1 hypothetical protein COLE_04832 [Cutaneotrichosporon oleaginosum]